jgi:hypothetical protein
MANQNPFSAIELFTSALRSNIIPNQEYLLQGSVIDSSAEVLHNRLRGKVLLNYALPLLLSHFLTVLFYSIQDCVMLRRLGQKHFTIMKCVSV